MRKMTLLGLALLVSIVPLTGFSRSLHTSALPVHHSLPRRDGTVPNISSLGIYRGQTVIAFFIATSCMYCAYEAKNELPKIIRWSKSHHVRVVIINGSDTLGIGRPGRTPTTGIDGAWTPNQNPYRLSADLEVWARLYGLSGYVYSNPSLQLFKQYKMNQFPAGVVLNSAGKFVAKWSGLLPISAVETIAKLANVDVLAR